MSIDTSKLELIRRDELQSLYWLEEDVVLIEPVLGAIDTETRARDSVAFLKALVRERGRPVAVVLLLDCLKGQDRRARKVHATAFRPEQLAGVAVVARSPLGRAIASFLLGFARSTVPISAFSSVDEARVWARSMLQRAADSLPPAGRG